MSPLATVTPSQVLQLWHSQPRFNFHSQLIGFANALTRALQTGRLPQAGKVQLQELNLPTMAYNALRRAGYAYVEELEGLTANELLLINHVGATSVKQIQEAVAAWRRRRRPGAEPMRHPAILSEEPPAPVSGEGIQSLEEAFYAWTTDRERIAAVLLRAADLIEGGGPDQLRSMAMAIVDNQASATAVERQ